MTEITKTEVPMLIASMTKSCPFCAGRGLLTNITGQSKFGFVCAGCLIRTLEKFQSAEQAVDAWCRRKNSAAAAGGRATRGISSWKKRRSSRRNLRGARKAKRWKRILAAIDLAYSVLKPLRVAEIAEAEAALAEDRSQLQKLEPVIRKYDQASQIYDWLQQRRALAKVAEQHPEDSRLGQLGNSVLTTK